MREIDFTPLEADVTAEQVEALRAEARQERWGRAAALDATPAGGFNVGCGAAAIAVCCSFMQLRSQRQRIPMRNSTGSWSGAFRGAAWAMPASTAKSRTKIPPARHIGNNG